MNQKIIYDYIYDAAPFVQHTPSHWWALMVSAMIIILVPYGARRLLSVSGHDFLGKLIGWTIFLSYFAWISLEMAAGTFSLKEHLPFQICRFTNLVVVLMLHFRKDLWFQILYFWTVTAVLQASFAPDMEQDFPHFYFIRFFIGHTGMILAIVYAWVIYEMRPTWKGFWIAYLATNIYMVFTITLNLILGSNYFYTLAKPETPSPLDYFGPWPWYILVCEVLMLVQAYVFYAHLWWPGLKRRFLQWVLKAGKK